MMRFTPRGGPARVHLLPWYDILQVPSLLLITLCDIIDKDGISLVMEKDLHLGENPLIYIKKYDLNLILRLKSKWLEMTLESNYMPDLVGLCGVLN